MAELSIIVPTLNAGAGLQRSLPPLAAFDSVNLVHEVILVDGGSTDETLEIAEAAGANVVTSERGRGLQLGAGAKASTGSWLLFLHADTSLDPRWHEAVWSFMHEPDNDRRAGYFRFKLDDKRKRAKLLERFVALRVHLFGLPYGDQGLLISKSFYNELGGYRAFPLLEDVDLVRRIGRARLVHLGRNAVTSAERYDRDGYVKRSVRNFFCLSAYFFGVPPQVIAKFYG